MKFDFIRIGTFPDILLHLRKYFSGPIHHHSQYSKNHFLFRINLRNIPEAHNMVLISPKSGVGVTQSYQKASGYYIP